MRATANTKASVRSIGASLRPGTGRPFAWIRRPRATAWRRAQNPCGQAFSKTFASVRSATASRNSMESSRCFNWPMRREQRFGPKSPPSHCALDRDSIETPRGQSCSTCSTGMPNISAIVSEHPASTLRPTRLPSPRRPGGRGTAGVRGAGFPPSVLNRGPAHRRGPPPRRSSAAARESPTAIALPRRFSPDSRALLPAGEKADFCPSDRDGIHRNRRTHPSGERGNRPAGRPKAIAAEDLVRDVYAPSPMKSTLTRVSSLEQLLLAEQVPRVHQGKFLKHLWMSWTFVMGMTRVPSSECRRTPDLPPWGGIIQQQRITSGDDNLSLAIAHFAAAHFSQNIQHHLEPERMQTVFRLLK